MFRQGAFDELCKYVCYQLVPSGIEELDREALNFAIYWQICDIFNHQVKTFFENQFSFNNYRERLQKLIDSNVTEKYNASEIIDHNISNQLAQFYVKEDCVKSKKLKKSTKSDLGTLNGNGIPNLNMSLSM